MKLQIDAVKTYTPINFEHSKVDYYNVALWAEEVEKVRPGTFSFKVCSRTKDRMKVKFKGDKKEIEKFLTSLATTKLATMFYWKWVLF